MKVVTFIYIAINLLFFNLVSAGSEMLTNIISGLCIAGILSIGIAHGAIDNVLSRNTEEHINDFDFFIRYTCFILLLAVLWWLFPNIAFILFFIISAFHFGQSQLTTNTLSNKLLQFITYVAWGLTILFISFLFNSADIVFLVEYYFPDLTSLGYFNAYALPFAIGFGSITIGLLVLHVVYGLISISRFVKELYILMLIGFSFYVLPLLVGFALYFVLLHSLKVMGEEYLHCRKHHNVKSFAQFIKLLLPLSVISIVGLIIIIVAMRYIGLSDWIPYVLLIALSCITVPHAFVMDGFYRKLD